MAKAKKIVTGKKEKTPSVFFLYIFLLPMFVSTIGSLFDANYIKFILKLIAFALLYGSINLINRGLQEEHKYNQEKIAHAPKIKFKLFGSIGLGAVALFLGLLVDKNVGLVNSIVTAVLAVAGGLMYYGFDPSVDKIPNDGSVNYEKLIKDLDEAETKLLSIEEAKDKISDLELKDAVGGALHRAENILQTIKDDPKDIRIARKFMVVYLDGIKDVVNRYNELEDHKLDESYRKRLVELLESASKRFDEELERLKSNDVFDLDVQIDALKQQLEN